jgi:hypothetical protein
MKQALSFHLKASSAFFADILLWLEFFQNFSFEKQTNSSQAAEYEI